VAPASSHRRAIEPDVIPSLPAKHCSVGAPTLLENLQHLQSHVKGLSRN
jgi:hypothetical protein